MTDPIQMAKPARKLFILLTMLGVLFASPSFAQDNSAEKSLNELQIEWKGVELDLKAKEAEWTAETNVEKKNQLRDEYAELVANGEAIISSMREVATKMVVENPKDTETLKALLSIMLNDARFGRESEVMTVGQQLTDAGINPGYFEFLAKDQKYPIPTREMFEELVIRQREAKADDLPRVELDTSQGKIVLELFENQAPNTVANFISLVESKYYDGLKFHRVMDGFMAQGGCPKGDGSGGPGYNINCECAIPEARRHFTGSLAMAHGGPNTGGSQFYMAFSQIETKVLDGKHTVFGRVIDGLDVLDKLTRTRDANDIPIPDTVADTIKTATVVRKREHEYVPVKVGDPAKKVDPPTTQPADELKKQSAEKTDKDADK